MHTFGIEIEVLLPSNLTQAAVATAISEAGVPCNAADYTHRATGTWKVVSDGSLGGRAGFSGHEVVSRVLSGGNLDEVNVVCNTLSRLGATVNRTCGLHVHVGARGFTLNHMKRLALLYAECETFLDSLLPPSRRANNNNYCRSVATTMRRDAVLAATQASGIASAIAGGERYAKLNFASFWKHGTVEFRHHSGTVDPEKILNWVRLCTKLVDTAQREETVMAAMTAQQPQVQNGLPSMFGPWNRGRYRRAVRQMLSRPEGATRSEIQTAYGLRCSPNVMAHARACGTTVYVIGRRNRERVYSFLPAENQRQAASTPAPIQLPPAPATFEAFLEKLQVTPGERTYWSERAALLSANT